mgnify:CR=1 FL=1
MDAWYDCGILYFYFVLIKSNVLRINKVLAYGKEVSYAFKKV